MNHDDPLTRNLLLGLIPPAESTRLAKHLVLVDMPLGALVYRAGDPVDHVYFPTDAIVSIRHTLADGASASIAVVGNDGLLGTEVVLGEETTPNTFTVQNPGRAYRLSSRILAEELRRSGAVQMLLLRYIQVMITQIAQTVVCNRYHSADQQLCRWLLLGIDCLPTSEPKVTRELVADITGVGRSSVTQAVTSLQDAGLVCYEDEYIEVLDRSGLERRACECYGVVKREFDRLFPHLHVTWN